MNLIIFSDLDGTLLNHDDYSFEAARPSLDRIRQHRIPLILTTSKTRREVEGVRKAMGIYDPYIVENGGGIYFPRGYRGFVIEQAEKSGGYNLLRLGLPYDRIRSFLVPTHKRFKTRGFGDLSVQSIAELTGLSPDQAALAKDREFTEPFIIEREVDIPSLSRLAAEEGMKVTRGGRFHHLTGIDQDKGEAVRIVSEIFRRNTRGGLFSVGLGDSENDLPMLQQVDLPILIPNPSRGYLDIQLPRLMRPGNPGCMGWNEAIGGLLDEFERDD